MRTERSLPLAAAAPPHPRLGSILWRSLDPSVFKVGRLLFAIAEKACGADEEQDHARARPLYRISGPRPPQTSK
eukprot:1344471-Alexandrium_andersonii.AAC.1